MVCAGREPPARPVPVAEMYRRHANKTFLTHCRGSCFGFLGRLARELTEYLPGTPPLKDPPPPLPKRTSSRPCLHTVCSVFIITRTSPRRNANLFIYVWRRCPSVAQCLHCPFFSPHFLCSPPFVCWSCILLFCCFFSLLLLWFPWPFLCCLSQTKESERTAEVWVKVLFVRSTKLNYSLINSYIYFFLSLFLCKECSQKKEQANKWTEEHRREFI